MKLKFFFDAKIHTAWNRIRSYWRQQKNTILPLFFTCLLFFFYNVKTFRNVCQVNTNSEKSNFHECNVCFILLYFPLCFLLNLNFISLHIFLTGMQSILREINSLNLVFMMLLFKMCFVFFICLHDMHTCF